MQKVKQNLTSRKTGQKTVTTTATPILQIGTTSSSNTTFTPTTAVDGSAWDLSDIITGDVAEASDGSAGVIESVNDGANSITVQGWYRIDTGWQLHIGVAANKPTDGSTIIIHRRSHAHLTVVKADLNNSDNISIGLHGNAIDADYELKPGESIPMVPEPPNKVLDLTQIYTIAASGSQTLHFMVGAKVAARSGDITINQIGLGWHFSWGTFADGDTTPDVKDGKPFKTANTGATEITNFDGGVDGQIIKIYFGDVNTTIIAGASIRMQGGITNPQNDFGPSVIGDMMEFILHTAQWVEVGRSLNS